MMVKKYNFFSLLIILQLLLVVILSSFHSIKQDPKRKVRTIVIDPGHGGKDPGCNGVFCKEKEVSLAVALKLGKLIEEKMKDVKVIFTRTTDVFVELEDRAKIANDNNADLFISIHCNAAGKPVMIKDKKTGKMRPKTFKNSKGKLIVVETVNPEPFGSETYVMGLKNEEGKMKVAQRENSAMLLEDNYEKKYQGFDPNSEESYIIMSNYTSSYVIQSADLALKIQEQYSKKAGRVDKGVHRQSIWVLWRTSMPSVLTEIGYLTNPQEEKFLGSEKGQTYIAACLFRAFRKYKDEQEGIKKTYNDDIENQVPLPQETFTVSKTSTAINNEKEDTKDLSSKPDSTEKDEDDVNDKKIIEEAEAKVKAKAIADSIAKAKSQQKIKDDLAKKNMLDSLEKVKANKAKEIAEQKLQDEARKKHKTDSINAVQEKIAKENEIERKYKQFVALGEVNFKNKKYEDAIQMFQKALEIDVKDKSYAQKKVNEINTIIANEKNKQEEKINTTKTESAVVSENDIVFKIQFASSDKEVDVKTKFSNVNDVWFYKSGAIFKYTSGNFKSINEASQHQSKLKEMGYKDCFIAAFKNNQRMNIEEARKATENKK
jgi:N-acetylmuramoyl-L-alanine amidase